MHCNALQCLTEHFCTPASKEHLQDQWCHLLVMQQKMQPEAILKDKNIPEYCFFLKNGKSFKTLETSIFVELHQCQDSAYWNQFIFYQHSVLNKRSAFLAHMRQCWAEARESDWNGFSNLIKLSSKQGVCMSNYDSA